MKHVFDVAVSLVVTFTSMHASTYTQEEIECGIDDSPLQGDRPAGSECSVRRRRNRVCMMYNDDGTASSKMRCATAAMSRCYQRSEGAACVGYSSGTCSRSVGGALVCTSHSNAGCVGKANGNPCTFMTSENVGRSTYEQFLANSRCLYEKCQKPAWGSCYNAAKGRKCAEYVQLFEKRVIPDHRRRRAPVQIQIWEEQMSGGTCKGSTAWERECVGSVLKSSRRLHSEYMVSGGRGAPCIAVWLFGLTSWSCFVGQSLCIG
eukprot:TRINITY_DN45806_c0_g1_i1.p1 TRINITY_DN45806_c0_g1~~TRINITY_DN45806_c0_g1_i1.p1  ORF type:complete len:262 (+),score=16.35 TRINITY_DN45806_c0_g1_i1:58-843(+)